MVSEMLSDWRFWLFIVNVSGICLLKFNDFRHMSKTLNEIKTDIKDIKHVQISQGEDIARIQGQLGINKD